MSVVDFGRADRAGLSSGKPGLSCVSGLPAMYNRHVKRAPIILLLLIVVLPLALLAWAGLRLSQHQQWQSEQRIRRLLTGQLREDDRTIAESFNTLAADLHQLTALDEYETETLRDVVRRDPRLFQLFVIDPEDVLIFPDPNGPLLQSEREFIFRAAQIINDRELQRLAAGEATGGRSPESDARLSPRDGNGAAVPSPTGARPASGWFTWYWGPGLNLMYWQRRPAGHIVGAALERSRWIADLIGGLPDTSAPTGDESSTPLKIRLVEAGGDVVYEWGQFLPEPSAVPSGQIRLSKPLEAWQLHVFAPLSELTQSADDAAYFNLLAGLTVAGVALTVLALIFYQQYARDMREAGQRVSFVNQVSHELRTPLTNIRMYAELIDSDMEKLADVSEESQRRVGVIVAETGRLGRLIDNVLTFARQERNALQLSVRRCEVDGVINSVVARFQGSLDQLNIITELDLHAEEPCLADPDALEQILENLISNVEKYAATGQWMQLTSGQQDGRTTVTVADRGPGIPTHVRDRVFEPFWRASDDLNQAAGTGIGLSIARQMARLHGGDLTLAPSPQGTTFRLELSTPPVLGDAL